MAHTWAHGTDSKAAALHEMSKAGVRQPVQRTSFHKDVFLEPVEGYVDSQGRVPGAS
jgi:hypothetical protein